MCVAAPDKHWYPSDFNRHLETTDAFAPWRRELRRGDSYTLPFKAKHASWQSQHLLIDQCSREWCLLAHLAESRECADCLRGNCMRDLDY